MINVKKKDPMFYEVAISTIGTNAHSCTFYGAAHPVSSTTLKAVAPATAVNPDTGEWEETTCEVTLKYKNNKVSVEDNGKCREYCGARAHLFIDGAKRK